MVPAVKKNTAMELLAPVGSFSAFSAAVEEGADAVYVGAPDLNARALSRDFSYPEIHALVREARRQGIKVYIAMNSLVKEAEIMDGLEALATLEAIAPDGLIIQDMGLFRLAREFFPRLELHASTLLAAHNSLAVEELVRLGFRRVVLPRELTIGEIAEIHGKTGAELEIFVHGAMCFSYSGLCLFSSLHGGKSSLRGRCVQPCRRKYAWEKEKGKSRGGPGAGGYLFSMNDLCGIDLLRKLAAAGVASLKIEGRMKSAEYVRNTVRAYRLLLDAPPGTEQERMREAGECLDRAMGRRRASGFFLGAAPGNAIQPTFSGNIGVPVGRVRGIEEGAGRGRTRQATLSVELLAGVRVGERLRFHDEDSGERTGFTLRELRRGNRRVKSAEPGQKVKISLPVGAFSPGKREPRGMLFRVDVAGDASAERHARDRILRRAGRVPKVETAGRIPDGARRRLAPQEGKGKKAHAGRNILPIRVMIRSLRHRQYRLPAAPERYIVPVSRENLDLLAGASERIRRRDSELVWALPPVIDEGLVPWYIARIGELVSEGFTAFQLGHFTQAGLFGRFRREGVDLEISGHYTLNVLNSLALEQFADLGIRSLQFSLETDRGNLEEALRRFRAISLHAGSETGSVQVGLYVYGHPPLFTARLDDRRFRYGRRFVSPRGEVFVLARDEGLTTAHAVLPFSLLGYRKELARHGIDYLVVDLRHGNVKKNITGFSACYRGRGDEEKVMSGNFDAVLF
ncbi:MAG: hypothetical protein Kow0089_20120 [Desulfobulbaceae bacterium]